MSHNEAKETLAATDQVADAVPGAREPAAKTPSDTWDTFAFATRCATLHDPKHKDQYGASVTPVYMSATFKGGPGAEFDYSRSGNPTRTAVQAHMCQLQQCHHSFAVSTGMAALDVITRLVPAGQRMVAGDDLYGGTNRLLVLLRSLYDVSTDHVDTTDAAVFSAHLAQCAEDHRAGQAPPVAMVLLESPTNPLIKVCDMRRCIAAVREHAPNALVVVDNTMMSPYLMHPLELGADIVYDSATKYLSGHHDLMAGIIACDRDDLAQRLGFLINSVGNALSPMDSFVLLRGMKTLAVRMDRQQENAMRVAHFLHALGFRVHYPGLRTHPGHAMHASQAAGPGAVLSFETGNRELSAKITAATKLWGVSVSFGCVNSLISIPCLMSHASIDPKVRAERGLPENLIRLCVGIEDAQDLLGDLAQALLSAGAIRRRAAPGRCVEAAQFERVPVEDEMDVLRASLRRAHVAPEAAAPPAELCVSAPGKVILFGEHAVVHGVTAIAAATALRCYARTAPRSDHLVHLAMPDISLDAYWDAGALPWDKAQPLEARGTQPPAPSLEPQLLAALDALVSPTFPAGDRRHAASMAFLYLYLHLGQRTGGRTFVLRSALPISAGLGSSAAVSVCLASMLLYTRGTLPVPGEQAVPEEHTACINGYAFLAEKVIHGEPSGVDNTVATLGGALAFTRMHPANRLVPIRGFDAVRLLITDTRVPRNTKALVSSVLDQKNAEPERVQAALDAIQLIADDAQELLDPPTGVPLPRDALLKRLGRLMDMNHLQLVQLRVGHPTLEAVRSTCAAPPYALHTKLTGAGGGGCAITLLPPELDAKATQSLLASLQGQGWATYATEVGGAGMGVLVHGGQHAEAMDGLPVGQLASWAASAGSWAFA